MITEEMKKWYFKRLNNHVKLVQKWYGRIYAFTGIDEVSVKYHDMSKMGEPELTPYIYTVWKQKANLEGFDYEIPKDMVDSCHAATIHHIITNKHHPEYWDDNFDAEKSFNRENRDAVAEHPVDATKMPMKYIAEKLADWMATAEERGTDPYAWAELNINKRWLMTDKQIAFTYLLLDKVWSVYQ